MDTIYTSLSLDQPASIRLISILPRSETEPVSITLRTASLDDPTLRYQALSYTWGDPTSPQVVICNDAPLAVTRNLYSALIRLPQFPQNLGDEHYREIGVEDRQLSDLYWIDAICINQKDWAERGSQVQQMMRIYRQARVVWADLGESVSFKFDSKLSELINMLNDHAKWSDSSDRSVLWHNDALGDAETWSAWRKFLLKPYFTRLWVLQEYAVAKHLFYVLDENAFGSGGFNEAIQALRKQGFSEMYRRLLSSEDSGTAMAAMRGEEGIEYLESIRQQFLHPGWKTRLQDLLDASRAQAVTDPKDRIYAILGMVQDFDSRQPDMRITYDPTETIAAVYTRVARCMANGDAANAAYLLLEGGAINEDRLPELPSWVPDWTKRRATYPLGATGDASFHAATAIQLRVGCEDASNLLQVKAARVDVVKYRTPGLCLATDRQYNTIQLAVLRVEWTRAVLELCSTVDTEIYSARGIDPKEALWRTLIVNRTHMYELAGHDYAYGFERMLAYQEIVEAALSSLKPGTELQSIADDETGNFTRANQESRFYRMAMTSAMNWRSFQMTQQGYYMMAHHSVEIGDVVMLVAGLTVPLIMRKIAGSGDQWMLIGECYVHGIMDGELVETADWQQISIA